MMKLPDTVWSYRLSNGSTLKHSVGSTEPTCMPLNDLQAFRNVWVQRLDDAKTRNLFEPIKKSEAVLHFISEHEEIVLLIWPAKKLTALFSPQTDKALLLEK